MLSEVIYVTAILSVGRYKMSLLTSVPIKRPLMYFAGRMTRIVLYLATIVGLVAASRIDTSGVKRLSNTLAAAPDANRRHKELYSFGIGESFALFVTY